MSIFGSSATAAPATGTGGSIFGSFGQQNTNTNANQQQQQQQQPNSLFGASTNTNPGTQQSTGNPLFSGSNTNTGTGSSIFGQNTTGNSLFGKPATSTTGTSLFGGQTSAPVAGTNSLFGSNAAQPGAAGNSGSSFFAVPPAGQQQQQNTNQPKTGLFGTTGTSTNPLFGGTPTATTNTSNNAAGSLFGGGSTSNSLFGGSTLGQTGTGTLFGSSNVAPGAAAGGSTLGGAFLGGNSTLGTSTLGTSALGKPAGGLVSSSLGSQSQDVHVQSARLQEKIEEIYGAWNAKNPATCRFQHYFYNIVEPSQVNLYGRPPNAVNEVLWQKAVRENPDPSCLVPVLAVGFEDLRGRVDAQVSQSAAQKEKLLELQQKLRTLSTNHSTLTVPRLQRYAALQTQLMHRLLRLVQHLHLLIPSVRSSAISENEEALRGVLEEVVAEVGVGPSHANSRSNGDMFGKGRLKSKLGELWAVIGALKAREQSLNATWGGSGEWKVVDEEGLARIAQILAEQQAGLAHLTKILHKDLKDLAIIMGTAQGGEQDLNADDLLQTSLGGRETPLRSSTLRMSALR
ncbi:nucleoporin complex subunit 54-domain-containing protein [Lentinula raphanica]|uniref:Nucleoporin complex subunit 54-domain-containing protein n=1 Tax=Lentinula raphanica TaxID=153919 RepID=A0AA38UG02_9AGAR|nr:nucleoporin complex subunit 54-domain-containing protein [Lentinula raphanica]KAJ3974443.1 nucleoporin complex subunit 54-domain-containing protein [Lentinula raphanica]